MAWFNQPHTRARGIVVNLPVSREEVLDILFREEIRRPMRTVEHSDVPGVGEARLQVRRKFRCLGASDILADVEHVAGHQHAASVAAELAERECRFASEIRGHIDAAAHGNIGADTGPLTPPIFRTCPALIEMACQYETGAPSSVAVSRPPKADDGIGIELEHRAGECCLDPRRAFIVADDAIGETKRKGIHRPRRRYPLL